MTHDPIKWHLKIALGHLKTARKMLGYYGIIDEIITKLEELIHDYEKEWV